MKKLYRRFTAFISAAIMLAAMCTSAYADSLKKSDGVMYRHSDDGVNKGAYTGWAKSSKGRYYYKNGVKVTGTALIKGKRYKFGENGVLIGEYTGFVKNSKGKRYYKNGVLAKNLLFRLKEGGTIYSADSSGYLTVIKDEDINPGQSVHFIGKNDGLLTDLQKDLWYGDWLYYLFIATEIFIYGEDGKCYGTGDLPDVVSKDGYKLGNNLFVNEEITALIKDGELLGRLNYAVGRAQAEFDVTVYEFDGGYLYAGGPEDGLVLISSKPYCYVDGVPIYLYTYAFKYTNPWFS